MEKLRKRYLYKKVLPKDPSKIYVNTKHIKIIVGLMIVALMLSVALSIVTFI